MGTYVFDLLHSKVGVSRDSDSVWPNVNDDHHWPCNETLEEVVDLLIRGSQFRACMIPPNHPLFRCSPKSAFSFAQQVIGEQELTIDLLEHLVHPLDIIMVQEPRLAILLVLLKRDAKRVRHIDRLSIILPKQHTNHTFCGVPRYSAGMVVCY